MIDRLVYFIYFSHNINFYGKYSEATSHTSYLLQYYAFSQCQISEAARGMQAKKALDSKRSHPYNLRCAFEIGPNGGISSVG